MGFHFGGDVDVGVFDGISFIECAVCPQFADCFDEWTLYYGEDNVSHSAVYRGDVDSNGSHRGVLSEFGDFVEGSYYCPDYAALLCNGGVVVVTYILSAAFTTTFAYLLWVIACDAVRRWRGRQGERWHSRKPTLSTLHFATYSDVAITVALFWFTLKVLLLDHFTALYCATRYDVS